MSTQESCIQYYV